MNVSLPVELGDEVHSKVERGEYASASEVVREGLRLLLDRDRERALLAHLEKVVLEGKDPGPPPGFAAAEWESKKRDVLGGIRERIREGFESIARGEGIPGDRVIAELRESSRGRRAERG
ncbi:MAG: type II toxin-antitoxin system ParD family antitoxin [Candidatus Methylomirabilis sp.]|nr:type II toxin-antitoxin system ParD family antitoxin [Deltaproteobacteria bacterium]